MKVILAVCALDSHVVGLIPNDADEVVFMNDFLHGLEPGQMKVGAFKVYNFEPAARRPMLFGTMVYPVARGGFKVMT